MANIQTPTINRIYKVKEYDLTHTAIKMGNMYMCTDTQNLYYDSADNRRDRYSYIGVRTLQELQYKITPSLYGVYYCWEDNSLWIWLNKWKSLWSNYTYPSAYMYDTNNHINDIYIENGAGIVVDNNGLLKDGSVVIRDVNRLIKGKIYIDEDDNVLGISSFLGGGIRILPSGRNSTNGELYIRDIPVETNDGILYVPYATIRSAFATMNDEMYVDYSENPDTDPSGYPNPEHKYRVFHEGNLDTSAIRILTPTEIYNKLLDDSVPNPMNFNVAKVGGKTIDEIALVNHTHTTSNISDFVSASRAQADVEIKQLINTSSGEGIDASYNSATNELSFSAHNFGITLSGGVRGSAIVSHLSDTNIDVTVDPSKHAHNNYILRMDSLQEQINLIQFDPALYYTKSAVDTMIGDITPTSTPVVGKPLLVNSSGILNGTTAYAKELDHNITITCTGGVSGTIALDTSQSAITSNLSIDTTSANFNQAVNTIINAKVYKINLGNGTDTSFIVRHGLNATDLITQYRSNVTGEVVMLSDTVLDGDRLQVDADSVLANNEIKLTIFAL